MKFLKKIRSRYSTNIDRQLKLFFVEDEIYYARLVKANLSKMGFEDVTGFESGEELLLHLGSGVEPDIIILDYIIKGGMDAFETLTEVKKYNLNTEIVILSGQSEVSKATTIIKNGATDYIVKNNMTFFNLENCLMKIKKTIYLKLETKMKAARSKIFYLSVIFLIWCTLAFLMYFKPTFGIF